MASSSKRKPKNTTPKSRVKVGLAKHRSVGKKQHASKRASLPRVGTAHVEAKVVDDPVESIKTSFQISHDDESATAAKPDKKEQLADELLLIGQQFRTRLELLWAYIVDVSSAANVTQVENMVSLPILLNQLAVRESESVGKSDAAIFSFTTNFHQQFKSGRKNESSITLKVYERKHSSKILELIKYTNAANNILNDTAVQQIHNCFEEMLARLLDCYFMNKPEAVPAAMTIPYQEVLSFNDLGDAKRFVVNKTIEDFLKRKTLDDQFAFIKQEFKVDIPSLFPELPSFKEFVLRRNVIVHAGGRATGEYIRKLPKGLPNRPHVKVGERLDTDFEYVQNVWRLTWTLGVILVHQVLRNYCRFEKLVNYEDNADGFMNQAAYLCIKASHLDAAEALLQYASPLSYRKDTQKLTIAVNLAQTYLWKGASEDCEKVLLEHDWNATNSLFRLCVAALRGDRKLFKRELKNAHGEGSIDIFDLVEWPVFQRIRKDEEFKSWVEELFGAGALDGSDDIDVRLLNVSASERLRALVEKARARKVNRERHEGKKGHRTESEK